MPDSISSLFQAVKSKRPVLSCILEKYGAKTLQDFSLVTKNKAEFNRASVQNRDDFIRVSYNLLEKSLGKDSAERLKKTLESNSNILTANHQCANISDLPVQGTINFALSSERRAIIPVFAFGDIPLNNSRYPRGILFADNIKLPIFPERYKSTLVTSCPPFTGEFVKNAFARLNSLYGSKTITADQFKSACSFLEKFYLDKDVLSCTDYATQALLLSRSIWSSLFAGDTVMAETELIHIEIEKVVVELLKSDLFNQSSLIYNILFDSHLREKTLDALNSCPGCWDTLRLNGLAESHTNIDDNNLLAGSGTIFFWGADDKGRRVPLFLSKSSGKSYFLNSINSRDNFSIPFNPDSLNEALESKKIIPGLFMSFAAVSFARGYKCHGGFMQVDYLTRMKLGLVSALSDCSFKKWSESIASIETENYSTGMIFILFEKNDGTIVPAGAVEIASKGGLTNENFKKINSLTLNQANIPGLPAVYKTVFRPDERDDRLAALTVSDLVKNHSDKFVIIR